MATHDYVISNGTGSAVRSDINGALAAIVSQNSNASEPATMYAYQWWADTTTGLLKIRNAANSAWVTIGTLASANLGLLPLAGGTMTGVLAVTAGTAALPGIAVSGDPNTGIYSPGADQVAISTGGTVRATVDSSGRLLVGTSSAVSNVARFGADATPTTQFLTSTESWSTGLGLINYSSGGFAPVLTFGLSGSTTIGTNALVSSGNRLGVITFNGNDGTNFEEGARIEAFVDGTPGANDMPGRLVFSTTADGGSSPTSSPPAMTIKSSQEVLIGTSTITANGGILQLKSGITFPATAVAASDPNTLDDYEEGTWTPTVIGTTAAGTVTYSVRNARYTKIGRTVFVELLLNWSAGTGTGNLRVGGLPFTSGSATTTPALALTFCSDITMTASHILTTRVADNSTQIEFLSYPSGGGAYATVVYDAAGILGVAGSYSV